MRNIEEVLKINTQNEIIDEIFNQVYKVELTKYDRFNGASVRTDGYYISLPTMSKAQIGATHPIFRMFYTVEKLALKVFIGDTNETDIESNKQFGRLYLVEALNMYLEGDFNKHVEKALKIYHIDNFKDVLRDKRCCSKLCNFLIKRVENKMRDLIRKSNVDAYYDSKSRKFKKNSYIYLDAEIEGNDGDMMVQHEVVADEFAVIDKETKMNLYKYIYENYIEDTDLLLNRQKEFFKDMSENARIDGKVVVCEGYSKQQISRFKKDILKRIEKAIADDENIEKIIIDGKIVKYFLRITEHIN